MYERSYKNRLLKDDQALPRKKKKFPWKRVLYTFIVLAFISGVVFLIRMPRLQIASITTQGTVVADPLEVSQFVEQNLSGNYLYLFPKRSMLLVPLDSLERSIKQKWPRFKEVSVSRAGLNSLSVEVIEYQGVYLWCKEETCYFMDSEGTVFAPAPYFSGDAYPKLYGGIQGELAFQPFEPMVIEVVRELADRLPKIHIAPKGYHLENRSQMRILFTHNGNEASIIIDPNGDLEKTLEALYTGLRTDPLAGMYRDQTKVLEYIDLRFPSKVVYKFQ